MKRARKANPLDARIGAEIRRIRREQEMSQETLGDADGVTFQQVQKHEKGAAMRVSTLVRYCERLGVDPKIVLGRCLK